MKAIAQTDSQRGERTAFVLAVDYNSMHPHAHHPPLSVSKRINNQHLKWSPCACRRHWLEVFARSLLVLSRPVLCLYLDLCHADVLMKCEKWSRSMSCPFWPQIPGVWGYRKASMCVLGKREGVYAEYSHILYHPQGADSGETRLISLFTPNLTKSPALWMKRDALCSAALCVANKA